MIRRSIALLLLCTPLGALGEVRPSDINRPVGEDGLGPGYGGNTTQWALELVGFFGTRGEGIGEADVVHLGPTLRLATPAGRNEVEVVGALMRHQTTSTVNDAEQSTWQLSNLHLAHHWAWRSLARQTRAGLGITLPTAQLPRSNRADIFFSQVALSTRTAMHAWREQWLYRPETLTLTGHLDSYWRDASGLIVGGAVVAGFMTRTSDTNVVPEDDVIVQLEGEVAYDTVHVRSAIDASIVAVPTTELDETWQASIEPDFRIRLGVIDLVLRMTIPLNEPSGFAFSDTGFWALHVGVANGTQLQLPYDADEEEEPITP